MVYFYIASPQVCHHFIGITAVEGELDGAYNSGPSVIRKLEAGQSFLSSAAEFVKEKYISKSGEAAQFALMALVMGHGDCSCCSCWSSACRGWWV